MSDSEESKGAEKLAQNKIRPTRVFSVLTAQEKKMKARQFFVFAEVAEITHMPSFNLKLAI